MAVSVRKFVTLTRPPTDHHYAAGEACHTLASATGSPLTAATRCCLRVPQLLRSAAVSAIAGRRFDVGGEVARWLVGSPRAYETHLSRGEGQV